MENDGPPREFVRHPLCRVTRTRTLGKRYDYLITAPKSTNALARHIQHIQDDEREGAMPIVTPFPGRAGTLVYVAGLGKRMNTLTVDASLAMKLLTCR